MLLKNWYLSSTNFQWIIDIFSQFRPFFSLIASSLTNIKCDPLDCHMTVHISCHARKMSLFWHCSLLSRQHWSRVTKKLEEKSKKLWKSWKKLATLFKLQVSNTWFRGHPTLEAVFTKQKPRQDPKVGPVKTKDRDVLKSFDRISIRNWEVLLDMY